MDCAASNQVLSTTNKPIASLGIQSTSLMHGIRAAYAGVITADAGRGQQGRKGDAPEGLGASLGGDLEAVEGAGGTGGASSTGATGGAEKTTGVSGVCAAWIRPRDGQRSKTSSAHSSDSLKDLFWGMRPSMSRVKRAQIDVPGDVAAAGAGAGAGGKEKGRGKGSGRRKDKWPDAFLKSRMVSDVDVQVGPEQQTIDPFAIEGFECRICRCVHVVRDEGKGAG